MRYSRPVMRLVAKIVVSLIINTVTLLVAAILLSDFRIDVLEFPIVVVIFTVVELIARPALETVIDENAQWAASFVNLVAAFVTLLVTDLVSDGLDIEGIGTWIIATLIVWGGAFIVSLLFAERMIRKIAGDRERR